jgi:hypothetical protein
VSNELRRQTQKRDRNQWIKPQPRQAAGYFVRARYEAGLPPFFAGTHWTFPAPPELIKAASENFDDPNSYPVDACGLACHYAYIGIKRLGAGQFYLIKDKDGENYDGGEIYRLHVPPNVPIEQYWSLTVYDRTPTRSSRTSIAPAAPRTAPRSRRTRTGLSISIWAPRHLPARSRTGFRPTRLASSS